MQPVHLSGIILKASVICQTLILSVTRPFCWVKSLVEVADPWLADLSAGAILSNAMSASQRLIAQSEDCSAGADAIPAERSTRPPENLDLTKDCR